MSSGSQNYAIRGRIGSGQTSFNRLFVGSCCDGRLTNHRGLELCGSHAAEAALAAAPVVECLDPADAVLTTVES